MIGLVLYFVFGALVIRYEKPVHFAAGYAGMSAAFSIVIGEPLVGTLLAGLILFAYTAFVYMVVDRYGDQVLAPIGVLVVGALILLGASYYF